MLSFEPILGKIVKHFWTSAAKERSFLLINRDRQAEAWFKVELMIVMNELEEDGVIYKWYSEVTYKEKRKGKSPTYDFVVKDRGGRCMGIEVKTAFVGRQKKRPLPKIPADKDDFRDPPGSSYPLSFYLTNGRNGKGGVAGDAFRLIKVPDRFLAKRICLLFAYGCQDKFSRFGKKTIDPNDVPKHFTEALQDKIKPIKAKLVNGSRYIDFQECRLWILAYTVS